LRQLTYKSPISWTIKKSAFTHSLYINIGDLQSQ